MPRGIRYDGEYIVGGNSNARLTPNFKVKEFSRRNGKIFIHRELVATVQQLRDAYGHPIRITGLYPRGNFGRNKIGTFVWVSVQTPDRLEGAAGQLLKLKLISRLAKRNGDIYVEAPEKLPDLPPRPAFESAIRVTAGYETSGDPFQQVTGNFDGAGLSFGPLQWNFGTGTLPKLFQRFIAVDEAALKGCFERLDHYYEWMYIVYSPKKRQIEWADQLSRGASKYTFAQPWTRYLQAVGRVPAFRDEMLGYAYDVYGRKLIVAISWLKGVSLIRIRHFTCLSALYDLCVQQGSLDKAHRNIRRRIEQEQPKEQFELTRIAVVERGKTANPRWRADCISRRLGILNRQPTRVIESGHSAFRDNLAFHLVRNTSVRDVEQYLS
jgi:hypothetical protein